MEDAGSTGFEVEARRHSLVCAVGSRNGHDQSLGLALMNSVSFLADVEREKLRQIYPGAVMLLVFIVFHHFLHLLLSLLQEVHNYSSGLCMWNED